MRRNTIKRIGAIVFLIIVLNLLGGCGVNNMITTVPSKDLMTGVNVESSLTDTEIAKWMEDERAHDKIDETVGKTCQEPYFRPVGETDEEQREHTAQGHAAAVRKTVERKGRDKDGKSQHHAGTGHFIGRKMDLPDPQQAEEQKEKSQQRNKSERRCRQGFS